MNGNYYNNPTFPGSPTSMGTPNQQTVPTAPSTIQGITGLPIEQSYIENILRLNRGKVAKFYMSYPDSVEWRDKVFEGVIEAAGRDHIIISDPKSGVWYLLLIIYLNYVEFSEPIIYDPGFTLNK